MSEAYFHRKHDKGKFDWHAEVRQTFDWYSDFGGAYKPADCILKAPEVCPAVVAAKCLVRYLTYDRVYAGWLVKALDALCPSMQTRMEMVLDVLRFGEKKYERDSWQTVPEGSTRYFSAAMRHLVEDPSEWHDDQTPRFYIPAHRDVESGLYSYAHAACDIYFLIELDHSRRV